MNLLASNNNTTLSKPKNVLGRGSTLLMTPGQFTKGSSLIKATSTTLNSERAIKETSTESEVLPAESKVLQYQDIDAAEADLERDVYEDVEDVVSNTLNHIDEQKDDNTTPVSLNVLPQDEIGTIMPEDLSSTVKIGEEGDQVDEESSELSEYVEDEASEEDGSESSLMTKLMGDFALGSDSVSSSDTTGDSSFVSEPRLVEIPTKSEPHVIEATPTPDQNSNLIVRSEDEKWKIYNVKRKINTLVKNASAKSLSSVFVELEKLIDERPLSSRYTDCSEVQLCCEVIVRNAVQRTDFLPLAPCLLKMIADRQPVEFRQYFGNICDTKCKEFVTLSASDELLNISGQNFCKLLGHLYSLPRQMDDILFDIMHDVVGEYVVRWSFLEDATVPIGGVREEEMGVSASALKCLLLEVAFKMKDNDIKVQRGMEKFVWYLRESVLNGKVPRKIREIYLDSLLAVQNNDSTDKNSEPSGVLPSCTNDDGNEVEIIDVVASANIGEPSSSQCLQVGAKKFGDIPILKNQVVDGGSLEDENDPDIIVEEEYGDNNNKSDEQMSEHIHKQFNKPVSVCSSDCKKQSKLPLGRGRGMACLDFQTKETSRPVAKVLPVVGYNMCIGNAKTFPVHDQFEDSPQTGRSNRNHNQSHSNNIRPLINKNIKNSSDHSIENHSIINSSHITKHIHCNSENEINSSSNNNGNSLNHNNNSNDSIDIPVVEMAHRHSIQV